MLTRGEFGERTLRFLPVPDFYARLERLGHIPLPPYIDREDTAEDRERYQTVFARDPGSVAAPTAGLHFTDEILARLRDKGVETASVTLHVGLGTFAPIRTEVVEEHKIHTEWYQIPDETAEQITRAKREGRRVVAVGTTTVRTLEYAAGGGARQIKQPRQMPHSARSGEYPSAHAQRRGGYFHLSGIPLPGGGCDADEFSSAEEHAADAGFGLCRTRAGAGAYDHAVRERYRFFSYGDCMFIE